MLKSLCSSRRYVVACFAPKFLASSNLENKHFTLLHSSTELSKLYDSRMLHFLLINYQLVGHDIGYRHLLRCQCSDNPSHKFAMTANRPSRKLQAQLAKSPSNNAKAGCIVRPEYKDISHVIRQLQMQCIYRPAHTVTSNL